MMNSVSGSACMLAAWLLAAGMASAAPAEWFVEAGATGTGTAEAPFGRIQEALDAAQPGDTIIVRPGDYAESLQTVRGGTEEAPITLRTEKGRGSVTIAFPKKVFYINHPYLVIDGFVFDGEYGVSDILDIEDDADHLILRNSEVRRSGADCIDLNGPDGVLIENSLVHHCLRRGPKGRADAHGITAGHVRDLTIRNTDVHTFSGDGIQVDPDRDKRGWDNVLVEGCRIWLEPLETDENRFPAGVVPGENAIDLKAHNRVPRGTITIRDTEVWGFRKGLISNMAAFNLKENTRTIVDRVTVWDSAIAFRLRGPTGSRPAGAEVQIQNTVIHSVAFGIRYENNIRDVRLWNVTFGRDVEMAFRPARSPESEFDARNVAMHRRRLPGEVRGPSNRALGDDDFVNAREHDYRLSARSKAIDAGTDLPEVEVDREGVSRPQGRAYDIGAYERSASPTSGR